MLAVAGPFFLIPCFNICTEHSAAPIQAGWYGGMNECLTPLNLQKSEKVCAVNWGPLSDTSSSGNPKLEKKVCTALTVVAAVALQSETASIQFEWTSIITRTCHPSISAN